MSGQTTETHWHYRVYGQCLCSSIPLKELLRSSFKSRDASFRYVAPDQSLDFKGHSLRLLLRRETTLDCDLSLYGVGDSFLMRWEGRCDFLVSRDGRNIQCRPFLDSEAQWALGTLYNMVLSFSLFLGGVSNFHASAVVLPEGAVGFMADPGSGKSTLASGFTCAGFPFLTDDVLAVRENAGVFQGYPGYPRVSLSCHSLDGVCRTGPRPSVDYRNGEKERIAINDLGAEFSGQPEPLRALFILRRGASGSSLYLEGLPRVEAMRGLIEHTNCLALLPKDVLQSHMTFIERLTGSVPVYYLHYPSGMVDLPRVIVAVSREVRLLAAAPENGECPTGPGRVGKP